MFLAFTEKREWNGEIGVGRIEKYRWINIKGYLSTIRDDLEFEFSGPDKVYMEFKNQIGKF